MKHGIAEEKNANKIIKYWAQVTVRIIIKKEKVTRNTIQI